MRFFIPNKIYQQLCNIIHTQPHMFRPYIIHTVSTIRNGLQCKRFLISRITRDTAYSTQRVTNWMIKCCGSRHECIMYAYEKNKIIPWTTAKWYKYPVWRWNHSVVFVLTKCLLKIPFHSVPSNNKYRNGFQTIIETLRYHQRGYQTIVPTSTRTTIRQAWQWKGHIRRSANLLHRTLSNHCHGIEQSLRWRCWPNGDIAATSISTEFGIY